MAYHRHSGGLTGVAAGLNAGKRDAGTLQQRWSQDEDGPCIVRAVTHVVGVFARVRSLTDE